MARIRTVKPEFFRHEGLQDLEIANPGKYPMMVFEGLWGHCDKAGRFEWRPRTLKLDILPFLPFDMADTLGILERAGFVRRYVVGGKEYGEIGSFAEHQRFSGKELQEPGRFPSPDAEENQQVGFKEEPSPQQGSNGEATGKHPESQEGKGREGKGNGEKIESPDGDSSPASPPTEHGRTEADESGSDDSPGCPPCPIEKIVAEYHHALPMLARVRVLPEQTRKMLRARWREQPERQNVTWWKGFFEFVRDQCPFLVGAKTDFQADLLWLVRPTNFAKVLNGNYQARSA